MALLLERLEKSGGEQFWLASLLERCSDPQVRPVNRLGTSFSIYIESENTEEGGRRRFEDAPKETRESALLLRVVE